MPRSVPSRPEVGDPVVVDGTKYRIRAIGQLVSCRTSFGGQVAELDPRHLVWDPIAGVWRVRA